MTESKWDSKMHACSKSQCTTVLQPWLARSFNKLFVKSTFVRDSLCTFSSTQAQIVLIRKGGKNPVLLSDKGGVGRIVYT